MSSDRTPLPKLAAPARRALESVGIETLDDLEGYAEAKLAALHGMGASALETLEGAMADAGISFAAE